MTLRGYRANAFNMRCLKFISTLIVYTSLKAGVSHVRNYLFEGEFWYFSINSLARIESQI